MYDRLVVMEDRERDTDRSAHSAYDRESEGNYNLRIHDERKGK